MKYEPIGLEISPFAKQKVELLNRKQELDAREQFLQSIGQSQMGVKVGVNDQVR